MKYVKNRFIPNEKTRQVFQELLRLKKISDKAGITFYLCGYWGVAALNKKLFKDSSDIDLIVPKSHLSSFESMLREAGYQEVSYNFAYGYKTLFNRKKSILLDLGNEQNTNSVFANIDYKKSRTGTLRQVKFMVVDPRYMLINLTRHMIDNKKTINSEKAYYFYVLNKEIKKMFGRIPHGLGCIGSCTTLRHKYHLGIKMYKKNKPFEYYADSLETISLN